MSNIKYLQKQLRLPNYTTYLEFPLYFEIETVNACNADCLMCSIRKWRKHGNPLMEKRLFNKIAAEIIKYSEIVRTVNLSRDGEPLLDKDLERKIALLKEGNIGHVAFSTNVSLLTEKRAKSLISAGLDDIMFSIDGMAKETFESVRRGLDYDTVVENALRFISIRDEIAPSVRVRVRMVLQEKNLDEVADWGKYWRLKLKKQDRVYAKKIHNWGNQLDNVSVLPGRRIKLLTPCTSPFSTMIIKFNGVVVVCPMDFDLHYINGDLNNTTIKKVWQTGKYFDQFREIHMKCERDDFSFCSGCRLWESDGTKQEF